MPEPEPSTRDRLLEAAARLFAERGRELVSIRDIAAAAGVRHGCINYHFRSKDELYHETLMRFGPAAGRAEPPPQLPDDLSPEAARQIFAQVVRQAVELEVQPLDPVAAGLFRGEISRPEGPNDLLIERVIQPRARAMARLIGAMFPELTDERERDVAAFNVLSQCVFLRAARPVVLKLFGVDDFDDELTQLFADRIVQTALNGLGAPVGEAR
ncbi:MAG: CerR family C-terminal domain-containing protein [Planctomycetota bacterium]